MSIYLLELRGIGKADALRFQKEFNLEPKHLTLASENCRRRFLLLPDC